ncbi:MAG: 2-oxo-4-hydroxy-4-carboxy-5-ureidoimidazoline decarboxylase, partial [Pseudomonadota bacterium]
MTYTIELINTGSVANFVAQLDGTYEHSPWIAERAASARPFSSLVALKMALV